MSATNNSDVSNAPFSDGVAEYRLLASCITTPKLILRITEDIFTGPRVAVFRAMRDVYAMYGSITYEALYTKMAGAVPHELLAARPSHPEPLLDYLSELALRRSVAAIARTITTRLQSPDALSFSEVQRMLYLRPILTKDDSSVLDAMVTFLAEQQQRKTGSYQYVATGIPILDTMLYGEWPQSAMTTIIGQPGGGKTALICQSALHMAAQGIPTLVISLEMAKHRILARMLSQLAKVPLDHVWSGSFATPNDEQRFTEAVARIQTLPLYIVDTAHPMTIHDIAQVVHAHVMHQGVRAFFVDYLQIIATDKYHTSAFEAYGMAAHELRSIAREHRIAAVVVSQKNRQHSGLDAILGSSVIAHASDVVIEITFDQDAVSSTHRVATLSFLKHRDGKTGNVSCLYYPSTLTFV